MILKRTCFLILLFISAAVLKAQNSFSREPAVFITEFTSFIENSKDKESIDALKNFKTIWNNGKLTEDQKLQVLKLCNNMLIKKLAVDPYFRLVLTGLDNYFANGLNPALLKQWQEISAKLLVKNEKEYLAFLQTANSLFSDNIIFQSANRKWYSSNNNFEFIYDNKIAIRFKVLNLMCETASDKTIIAGTSGTYYPDKQVWSGDKGTINWERHGLPATEVSATLKKYQIEVNGSEFVCDSVSLIYPKYFPGKLYGKLKERVLGNPNDDVTKSNYPQFTSYNATIEIKGILGKEATYKGGFSIKGKDVNSQTTDNAPAVITLLYKNKPVVEARSTSFVIDSGRAKSLDAFITIFTDTGVIFHPKAFFSYDPIRKKMKITKGDKGLMQMPFTDTYHGIEIDVEQILWDQNKPYIDFDMLSNDKAAVIESNDFFKEFDYEKIQSLLNFNPLQQLYTYAIKVRTLEEPDKSKRKTFSINNYAAHLNTKKEFIFEQMMQLTDAGFIFYNETTDSITVRDKVFDWVSNNSHVKDYDIIRIQSVIGAKPNITLNLLSHELNVEGVRRFNFSDSQNVIAVPTNQFLTITKNKGIRFGGMIRAGRIDFYSKEFDFDYALFKTKDAEIDTMVLYFPDPELGGSLRKVQSVLSHTYGSIYIDKPNNKSGLRRDSVTSFYPKFVAKRGSTVNYDRAQTHNNAYKAETFHFQIDPFTIDSLDDFTIAGLSFEGTMKSAGIFDDFRGKVTIQPDYSLGFVTDIKMKMYGKGDADMSLSLSNRGLYGSGKIEYLGSTSLSDEYLILPDETNGVSQSFDLPESGKYPLVKGNNVQTNWYPKQDQMVQAKLEANLKIFKTAYDFDGKVTLSPADLRGDGILLWPEAEYQSKDMVFGKNKTKAEKSAVKIYALDAGKIAFETNDVKGDVDFDTRIGKFISNVTGSLTYFPHNLYASNMNDYTWDMNAKTIEIKPNAAMGKLKPTFVSTNGTYDSLKFECRYAKFDLKDFVLRMEKIPYIDVADSRVFPFDGKAIVREESKMDRLDSSRIEANKLDKFHEILMCRTTILGKYNLRATGNYKYVNKNKVEQALFLDSIRVDTAKHIAGYGKIPDTQNFTLDTKIGFKGLCRITSVSRPIEFIGYVRPMHSFTYMETLWIRYKNVVDPLNVVIDVHQPRDRDNNKLSNGLYFANDSSHVYPIMFDLKRRYKDPEILSDSGILYFDQAKNSFMIGNENKLITGSLKGNYMQFNETDKSVYAEGAVNLGLDLNKIKIRTAGTALHKSDDSTYRFHLMMLVDFPLPNSVTEPIYKFLTLEESGTAGFDNNNDFTEKAVSELIADNKTITKELKSISSSNKILGEDELSSGFLFSDMNIYFERVRRKFINTGPVGVCLFDGKPINKTFETTMTIEKRTNGGDKFTILMDAGNGEWLFLDYVRGVLYVVSSNAAINTAVSAYAEKQVDTEFTLRLGTERSKDNFLRKLE
ncbi:MAG: hypothetical protein H7321_02655 [Bacteroidia bacterium]|nr:hypothetical protein [Bacteroidia bacterium]